MINLIKRKELSTFILMGPLICDLLILLFPISFLSKFFSTLLADGEGRTSLLVAVSLIKITLNAKKSDFSDLLFQWIEFSFRIKQKKKKIKE